MLIEPGEARDCQHGQLAWNCDRCAGALEIAKLREALTELRDRIKSHPLYAELTESDENDMGGETAELSYMARVADKALREN
jgi:hypothetical protein